MIRCAPSIPRRTCSQGGPAGREAPASIPSWPWAATARLKNNLRSPTLRQNSASTAATLLARPPRSGFTARACRRSSASWASRRKGNKEDFLLNERQVRIFALLGIVFFGVALSLRAQSAQGKKVNMVSAMEGVSGILDTGLIGILYHSRRFGRCRRLLSVIINRSV